MSLTVSFNSKEQHIYQIGFNGFSQLDQCEWHEPSISAPALVASFPEHDIIGIYVGFEAAIAWSRLKILLFGWSQLFPTHLYYNYGNSTHMTGTILKDELSINGELKKCQVTSTTATRPVLILIQTTTLDLLQIETVGDIQQHRSNRLDQSNEKYKTHWIMSDCIEFAHTAEYGSAQLVSGLIVYWHLDDPAMVHTLAVSGFDRLPKLIDLCAGAVHCVALTEEGEVWTWRMGFATALHGQLGYIDSTVLADGFQAQIVEALQGMRMASISAGRQHTMVVSKDGTIYSFGSNRYSQLGIASSHGKPEPIDLDLESNSNIKSEIACGFHHSIATDGTRLYGAGWNSYNQLGRMKELGCIHEMRQLDIPLPAQCSIVGVYAGGWSTFILATVPCLQSNYQSETITHKSIAVKE
ncbi:hypothetical protein O5D80_005283 [Batrachochytrium dendrobatidis]|nr:hypothetical protein O5D80_005283 [Batrachochytrium dendrobatidis]